MGLDAALQDRVAGLFGDVTAQVVLAGSPLGLRDAVGRTATTASETSTEMTSTSDKR